MARDLRDRYGDQLDSSVGGGQLWKRAQELTTSHADARRLVNAVSSYANHTHWAHTILGIVALRTGDIVAAVNHLLKSGKVSAEPRLSSYGPSFALAKELCGVGRWTVVADYLQECERFWNVDELREMRNDVENQRIPDG